MCDSSIAILITAKVLSWGILQDMIDSLILYPDFKLVDRETIGFHLSIIDAPRHPFLIISQLHPGITLLRMLDLVIVINIVTVIARTIALYFLDIKYLLNVLLVARLNSWAVIVHTVVSLVELAAVVLHDGVEVVLETIGKRHLIEHLVDLLNVLTKVTRLHQLAVGSGPLEPTLVDGRVPVLVDYRYVSEQRGVLLNRILFDGWLALATNAR